MKKTVVLTSSLLAISYFGFAQVVPPIPTDSTVKVVKVPAGYVKQLDVVYCKVGPWDGRMDLYLNQASGLTNPVIVNLHGGGFNKGSKESQAGFSSFFNRGWSVANVEYRLSDYATAPAAVEDVRCALIYLINNAKKLNIDPDKIVLVGNSSGGSLALMGGLLENDHAFDKNCSTKEKVKVRAIVDKYGISDIGRWRSKSAAQWLGSRGNDEKFVRSVSAINYVKRSSPPTFIVHGNADPTVPYEQSVALHDKLLEMGVKTQLITVPGGAHGKFPPGVTREINEAMVKFLQETGL